jgi:Ca2+-binding RTX toxin-like protein
MHAIWFAGAALALPATLMPLTDSRDGVERTYECRGEPAVLADKDYWSGTQKRDVVVASADIVDTLNLLGGDDLACLYGDSYHGMIVNAGEGHDTIITVSGSHEMYGDEGNDIFYLHGYSDWVDGGAGNDHLWGLGSGGVHGYGGSGTDMLQGSPNGDTLEGGDDGDLIIGAGGSDTLRGDDGDDTLQGGAGADNLHGGAGDDHCEDGAGTSYTSCETVPIAPPLPEAG